ncbi:MAG: translation initiation factor [Leptolyngbyaceae bacterium]|nr:translation initiation factor [Leptolyngbyaceae bacterium]
MAAKRKNTQSEKGESNQQGDQGKRTVYSEFGSAAAAIERGMPDLPPNQQDIRIQTTRKGKGGKTVTVLTGFQSSPDTLKALLKKLKAQCGSGGTVKDQELEIQGDHAEALLQRLEALGYRAKISGGRR